MDMPGSNHELETNKRVLVRLSMQQIDTNKKKRHLIFTAFNADAMPSLTTIKCA